MSETFGRVPTPQMASENTLTKKPELKRQQQYVWGSKSGKKRASTYQGQAAELIVADGEEAKEHSLRQSYSASSHPPPEAMLKTGEDEYDDDSDDTLSVIDDTISEWVDEEEDELTVAEGEGYVWNAKVIQDSEGAVLKPCRPVPTITASELINGLELVSDKWIYRGKLNGWQGLVNLQLKYLFRERSLVGTAATITSKPWEMGIFAACCKADHKFVDAADEREAAGVSIQKIWTAKSGKALPKVTAIPKGTRACFVGPEWTQHGFTPLSPGFAFWFSPLSTREGFMSAFLCGSEMAEEQAMGSATTSLTLHNPSEANVTRCHMFAHRYPVVKESFRDRNTWHAGVMLEWDHGKFVTVVELAWLYGCSGYGGRSNWCEDKTDTVTELFEEMPSSMKCPWNTERCEVRAFDVPVTSLSGFEEYLHKYSTKGTLPPSEHRFLCPEVYASADVRLSFCTRGQLGRYLNNYASRVFKYETLSTNCQTFAADLYGFLTDSADAKPFVSFVQAVYVDRQRCFPYSYM